MPHSSSKAKSAQFDPLIKKIADYVFDYKVVDPAALLAAHYCLIDSLGCAFDARQHSDCNALIGPTVKGTLVPLGSRVPGTHWQLDPVEAAFSTSTLIRWLDFNDAFYGKTVIHPSDCLGALISVADHQSRLRRSQHLKPYTLKDLYICIIKAYEIMGGLAIDQEWTAKLGLDHVLLIKIGATALCTLLMGGNRQELMNGISNAWIDAQTLALFRRGDAAGARKSWAAGDAAARGVWLAWASLRGEMGYPTALSAQHWGFESIYLKGQTLSLKTSLSHNVIDNVQFKLSYPAGLHAQSAAEAAITAHPFVCNKITDIARITVHTHRYALSILNRIGPLKHFAERDHCLQYIVAIGLLYGRLQSSDYLEPIALDPRIDALRSITDLVESTDYTQAFYDPEKKANANRIQITFKDGSQSAVYEVLYPIGHPKRRKEGLPLLQRKFNKNTKNLFPQKQAQTIIDLSENFTTLQSLAVDEFLTLLSID